MVAPGGRAVSCEWGACVRPLTQVLGVHRRSARAVASAPSTEAACVSRQRPLGGLFLMSPSGGLFLKSLRGGCFL